MVVDLRRHQSAHRAYRALAGAQGLPHASPELRLCRTLRSHGRVLYIIARRHLRAFPSATVPSYERMPPRITSRAFTDTVGLEWTVREIANPSMTETLARVLERDRRRGGWLVFESSDGDKRRLAPYPPDWRTVSLFELERWCMKATRVPPAPARRAQD